MALIRVSDLSFTYDGSCDEIFNHVNFQIDTGWRLGLIGRNGRGKTTFLNLLLGKYEFQGRIWADVKFQYFPYPVGNKNRDTVEVFREICPDVMDWEISCELHQLDMEDGVLSRPFGTLSNGEQTRVLLAAMFLVPDGFLLIDEPTNHLDVDGRKAVQEYLSRKEGFILVSHDRALLDACVDHILSINRTNIQVQKGNFSSWRQNKERRDHFEFGQNARLKRDIAQLTTAAKRSKRWSDQVERSKIGAKISGVKADKGHIGRQAAKMMKRSKNIEARQKSAIVEKSKLLKDIETAESLKMYPMEYHHSTLLSLQELSIRYGAQTACEHVTFTVERGQRVVLRGKNGSGKSSVLKVICGEPLSYDGILQISRGIKISYVPQELSFLRGPLSDYADKRGIEESLLKSVLWKLDFSRAQMDRDMADLSDGQKRKVLLAQSICEPAHLYIWDEPLNYIDVLSREQIEDVILDYRPTLLVVEHDETFLSKIATKTVWL